MKKIKALAAILLATLGLSFQSHASVLTFDSVGDTGNVVFNATRDGASLSAIFGFTLTSLSATQATFSTTVNNNSSGPGQNVLTGFGIDVVSPTLTGASDNSLIFDASINDHFSGGFQSVDLCLYTSNNCSGGSINDGLGAGGATAFSLTLTTAGNFLDSGITFTSPYGIKFQGVGTTRNSFEFGGSCTGPACDNGGGGISAIPEPESLALFGIGLLALAVSRRRQT